VGWTRHHSGSRWEERVWSHSALSLPAALPPFQRCSLDREALPHPTGHLAALSDASRVEMTIALSLPHASVGPQPLRAHKTDSAT